MFGFMAVAPVRFPRARLASGAVRITKPTFRIKPVSQAGMVAW
jgi:hypothetical protein